MTENKKNKSKLTIILLLLLLLAIAGGIGAALYFKNQPVEGDTGTYLIPQGNMTREEAVAMLDKMAEESRITVSVAPYMVLKDDGQLRINFEVIAPNNGLNERIEVMQGDKVIYKSGIVEPGNAIVWGETNGAELGEATATIYAVNGKADTGNPVSVEVEIVEPGFKAPEESSSSTE